MMRRFVLTGAPGAGKTTIAQALRGLGHLVVDEAATDVIAETPALEADGPAFLDRIVAVQQARQLAARGPVQVFDRSPVCTLALAVYSGLTPTPALAREAARIERERTYERRVLFVRLMGFVTPTVARRISLAESQRFERIHAEVYRDLGYELIEVPPAPLARRVAQVAGFIAGTG
ncbi:AAA family ATPase [Dactylosporangium sp. NPDC048998]|uniref:AAA family ATPase n=1 Tax=Dactylosporangium sp. NPDC048998 TaxID=3363976 RepID=UPI003722523A